MILVLFLVQKKEMEKRKQHRDQIKKELSKFSGRGRGRGMPLNRYWNDFGSTTDRNEMRRQETLDKARMEQMMHRVSGCL
jgi:hypothetical protein